MPNVTKLPTLAVARKDAIAAMSINVDLMESLLRMMSQNLVLSPKGAERDRMSADYKLLAGDIYLTRRAIANLISSMRLDR